MDKKEIDINNDTFLAKWLANEITDNHLKELVSAKDYIAYKKLQQGILVYENLEHVNEETYTALKTKLTNSNKAKVRSLYIKWIASVAAVLILFLTITSTFFSNNTFLKKTGYGQNNAIALLDGSEVILNAKSEISYKKDQWKTKREVFLKGEGFFSVKKGSSFVVHTKNGSVTVLGTKFNVKSTSDYFEVVCFSGKVKVTNENKEYILKPTEGFRKINGNTYEKLYKDTTKPNWLSNVASYRSVPIKYVLKDIENQFGVVFKTNNIDLNTLFTGSFNYKDKEIVYKTVFNAMEFDYTIKSNQVVLYKK